MDDIVDIVFDIILILALGMVVLYGYGKLFLYIDNKTRVPGKVIAIPMDAERLKTPPGMPELK